VKPEGARPVAHEELRDGERLLVLENEELRAVITPGLGAAILELVHRRTGTQLLWRAPGALRHPGKDLPAEYDSSTSFFDFYPGGCQVVLPNGGPSVRHNGVELGFHGEACKLAWSWKLTETPTCSTVSCKTSLRRAPLDVSLSYSLAESACCLRIDATVRNLSAAPVDCMWGFHPAYGEPFLGTRTRLHIAAGGVEAHPEHFAQRQHVPPGFQGRWPTGPDACRLDYLFDGHGESADLLYLRCSDGWYVLHNEETGLAATMKWDTNVFPFVWLWQECQDKAGYPWFGRYHIVGVEPFTSYPSSGLAEALKRGTALHLAPKSTLSTVLQLGATRFSNRRGLAVVGVQEDGSVSFEKGEEND
jgi:galactose mutarotase-like enzyme